MKKAFDEKETSSILSNIIGQKKNFNQQKIIESIQLSQIHRFFKDFLPQLLREHIEIQKIHSRTLTIVADHGIYSQQIQFKKKEIIDKFKEKGIDFIEKIEIRTGKINMKEYKTGDIMSRSEKMSPENNEIHENADTIEKLLKDLKDIK